MQKGFTESRLEDAGLSKTQPCKYFVYMDWQIQQFICYCTVFALFYFVFEGNFQVQARGGLYSEGRFNWGLFALRA